MGARRVLAVILVIVGILAIIAGVIYLVVPAHSLPSFVPGHMAGVTAKHRTRGVAGILLGVVLVVIGAVLGRTSRSPYPR